jgi:hypothetical protein
MSRIAAGPRQRSYSRVGVPRDPWPYYTVSNSRLLHPGWPGPRIYLAKEQVGPVLSPGTGFPFRRLTTLRATVEYSNPPPYGV